jgi:1-acyl-sn-glycerol-3-phosphate acyltransferase
METGLIVKLPEAALQDGILPSGISEILHAPIPQLERFDRNLVRMVMIFTRKHLLGITGAEYIRHTDPFILVANHNNRLEALMLPAWLAYLREGKLIHFMADWNFRLIPGISLVLRRGKIIPVVTKSARPKFLNILKPRLTGKVHGFELAKQILTQGKSIGIFPEGTINPDPKCLLRGHIGAAKLSLETGVPIIPLGIRFPYQDRSQPIPAFAKMEIEIGAPIYPPQSENNKGFGDNEIRTLHSIMMQHLAELSQKHWNSLSSRRTTHEHSQKTQFGNPRH